MSKKRLVEPETNIDPDRVMEECNLQTDLAVVDASARWLARPFQIEHILDGELLYKVEITAPDENAPRGYAIPSDKPWSASLRARGFRNGDKVKLILKDAAGSKLISEYELF